MLGMLNLEVAAAVCLVELHGSRNPVGHAPEFKTLHLTFNVAARRRAALADQTQERGELSGTYVLCLLLSSS